MNIKLLLKLKISTNVENDTCCLQNSFHIAKETDNYFCHYQELVKNLFSILDKIRKNMFIYRVFNYFLVIDLKDNINQ